MNEEISRILDLLEKGTVTADEAQRLIQAARLTDATPSPNGIASEVPPRLHGGSAEEEADGHADRAVDDLWDPFSPFSNPLPDLGDFSRAFRRLRNRIRRHHVRRYWWNYHRLNRWYEHRRSQRRATMSVYERVRFVILAAPAHTDFVVQPQTDIHELLERDRIGWDLFRLGLEEEFGIELTIEQSHAFRTVQDVVDYVEKVIAAPAGPTGGQPPDESSAPPGSTEPAETSESAEPPKPGRPGRRSAGNEAMKPEPEQDTSPDSR